MKTVDELHQTWQHDPTYQEAYDALEEEFALAHAFLAARTQSGLTQEQLAERMHTSQSFIARLESGKVSPSTRTLFRFARATGHRLHISFDR